MTRSNEVCNRRGAFKESQWIGHSSRIRADHYPMLTDADYLKASQWEAPVVETKSSPAESALGIFLVDGFPSALSAQDAEGQKRQGAAIP